MTVKVDAKKLGSANEGSVVFAEVATTSINYEDVNENNTTVTGVTVTGNDIYLYTIVPTIALDSKSVTKPAGNTYTFTIKYKATAGGSDIWIKGGSSDAYLSINTTGGTTTGATISYPKVSATNATKVTIGSDEYWKILEDQTAVVTLKVTIATASSTNVGYYTVSVSGITWNATGSANNNVTLTTDWAIKDLKIIDEYLGYES